MKKFCSLFLVLIAYVVCIGCGRQEPKKKPLAAVGNITPENGTERAKLKNAAVLEFLGDDYSVESKGSITFLVQDGKRLGGGYHSYSVQNGAVYGHLGARDEVVIDAQGVVNDSGGSRGKELKEQQNKAAVLAALGKEYRFIRRGSLLYLAKGKRVSPRGFHAYVVKNSEVHGELGARTEVVYDAFGIWLDEEKAK